jgi:hypothetical protein
VLVVPTPWALKAVVVDLSGTACVVDLRAWAETSGGRDPLPRRQPVAGRGDRCSSGGRWADHDIAVGTAAGRFAGGFKPAEAADVPESEWDAMGRRGGAYLGATGDGFVGSEAGGG